MDAPPSTLRFHSTVKLPLETQALVMMARLEETFNSVNRSIDASEAEASQQVDVVLEEVTKYHDLGKMVKLRVWASVATACTKRTGAATIERRRVRQGDLARGNASPLSACTHSGFACL